MLSEASLKNRVNSKINAQRDVIFFSKTGIEYYPFGMAEPGRSFNLGNYRFSFNGKEHDDEIYGTDNSYSYGMRMYDPRLGRPPSTDPLFKQFPELSTYQFYSDNPIMNVDLDGKEASQSITTNDDGSTTVQTTIDLQVVNNSSLSDDVIMGYAQATAKQIEQSYSGFDFDLSGGYGNIKTINYETKVNLDSGPDIDQLPFSKPSFYLDYVNEVNFKGTPTTKYSGLTDNPGNTNSNRFQVMVDPIEMNWEGYMAEVVRTGAHEVGHGLGLTHPNKTESYTRPGNPDADREGVILGKDNLLRQSDQTSGTLINAGQLKEVSETIQKNTPQIIPIADPTIK